MNKAAARLLTALTANKGADVLVSPKTILPGLIMGIGLPPWVVGWLVPIREAFALLPQGFISVYLRDHPKRFLIWRIGMVIQILALTAMITLGASIFAEIVTLNSSLLMMLASVGMLMFLMVFSIGRSCCSLTFKDIQADTVNKGQRGKLIGKASMLSGLMTLIIAIPLAWGQPEESAATVLMIIGVALALFLLTLVLMWPIRTVVNSHSNAPYSLSSADCATPWWQNLVPDLDKQAWYFIGVRSIFVHSALVAPYFILSSQLDVQQLALYYLAAEALAALLSAQIWGSLADKSARLTLRIAGLMAIIACIGLMLLSVDSLWPSTLMFFMLSVAHTGVRTGRKTYTLDIKSGQERTELVGSANSFIGLILLLLGSFYAGLQTLIGNNVVWVMAAMLLVGIVSTFGLAKEK